jgi:hypothetical protein
VLARVDAERAVRAAVARADLLVSGEAVEPARARPATGVLAIAVGTIPLLVSSDPARPA